MSKLDRGNAMDFSTSFEELPLLVGNKSLDWLGNGSFLARDGEIIEIYLDHATEWQPGGFQKPTSQTVLHRPARWSNERNPLWDLIEGSILDHYAADVQQTRRRAAPDTAPIRISAQLG